MKTLIATGVLCLAASTANAQYIYIVPSPFQAQLDSSIPMRDTSAPIRSPQDVLLNAATIQALQAQAQAMRQYQAPQVQYTPLPSPPLQQYYPPQRYGCGTCMR